MRSLQSSKRTALVVVVTAVTILSAAFMLGKTFADDGQLPIASLILAAIWATGGALLWWIGPRRVTSPPIWGRRPWLWTLATAASISIACFAGGTLLLIWPPTSDWIRTALAVASSAPPLVTLVVALLAGAGEEIFFRIGFASLWSATLRWMLPTVAYAAVTLTTGNIALTLCAVVLGLCATAVREWTGTMYAPLVVHATWTLAMVGVFPVVARALAA